MSKKIGIRDTRLAEKLLIVTKETMADLKNPIPDWAE